MLKKRIAIVFLALLLLFAQLFIFPVSADSAKIDVAASGYLGNEITVTLNFECTSGDGKYGGVKGTLEFDNSILECTSYPACAVANGEEIYVINYENPLNDTNKGSLVFKFRGIKAGTAGLFFQGTVLDGGLDKGDPQQQTKSVKIIDKDSLSGNAKASKIILSAGKLVPAFNPDITNYNVNVDYSVDEILLSVTTQEGRASIKLEGDKKMKVGNNVRTVIITAPNGNEKRYRINIYRGASGEVVADPEPPQQQTAKNPYEITVEGATKYMVDDYSSVAIPNSFDIAMDNINGLEIQVLKDIINGRIVVYATDSDGLNGIYYIYNRENGSFVQFRYMESDGMKLIAFDYKDKVPDLKNYSYAAVDVGNYTVDGFKYKDSGMSDFVIFHAENSDGVKSFYRYDKRDHTVQRAAEFIREFENSVGTDAEKEKSIISRFMESDVKTKIIVVGGAIIIICIIVLIMVFTVKLIRKSSDEEELDDNDLLEGFGNGTQLFLDDNDSQSTGGFEE